MTDQSPATLRTSRRLAIIDAARGVAIVAMMIYHFCWDLSFHGFIAADVGGGPGWRVFARLIAGSFLLLVGVGLALAAERGMNWRRYFRRLLTISVAAAVITAVTWYIFPQSYIFFGILHCIALSSVVALPFLRMPPAVVLIAAALVIAAPRFLAGPAFDHPALLWLGLQGYFPNSNDYVPMAPWFGVVLAGLGLSRLALRWQGGRRAEAGRPPARPVSWLATAGRHSLPIYLLHQPVFFGLVAAATWVAPPGEAATQERFVESCVSFCIAEGTDTAICRTACGCLAQEAQAGGIWEAVRAAQLSADQMQRYRDMAEQCRRSALAP